jgi:transcription termination factor Rho
MDPGVLARKQLTELKGIASHLEMRGYQRLKKAELIEAIVAAARERGGDGSDGGGAAAAPEGNGGAVAVAERQRPETDGGQLSLEGADAPSGNGDQARTRVRTRTRERTVHGEPERNGAAHPVEAPEAAEPERPQVVEEPAAREAPEIAPDAGTIEPSEPVAREQGARPREQREPEAREDGDVREDDDNVVRLRDGDEAGGRRRRSRRERRRNKQGGPAPAPQGQGRPYRDEDLTAAEPGEVRSGVLDILPEGYGFLRTSGYLPGDRDVYVSQSQVRRYGLRRGDVIEGPVRQQKSNEKVPALHSVQLVNGLQPDDNGSLPHRPEFKDMTPLFPDERLRLETPDGPISMRIIDLMAPIGKGQRGLIVSPPKAGKTTILKELGQAIAYNNPECHVMVVLVDERPEEVTDMQRSVPGEIIASTFDRPADDHTQIAELAMERAKRLVEQGRDVVVLLDSITRLARAYNLAAPASGRIMSGGVDSTALYPPKRFFGAARNIEGGGSLTIIASALIETGSKMDEVIFEEFKGTGNCEIRLDRRLEQKRVFPAIDIEASGTRKEELLLDREELGVIWKLRRVLNALEGPASVELLIDKIKQTRSNNAFLVQIQKSNLSS